MTFAKWLELSNIDDAKAASLFKRDRAHISKLRRGKVTPSYELMLVIRDKSDGAVTLDSWQRPSLPKHKRREAGATA